MSYDPLWNNPMFANVGHFHYFVLMRSVCFNDVIFLPQLLLQSPRRPNKSTKRLQIEINLYHIFIALVRTEMCAHCLCAKAHAGGGFSKASVGGLPAPQQCRSMLLASFLCDLDQPHGYV